MQQHGRRFEHELVNGLEEITPREVWVTTCGFSGSANADDCDLVVTVDPHFTTRGETRQYNIEVKKKQGDRGNRVTVFSGSSDGDSGLDELQAVADGAPPWADPVVAVKFDHCKLVVLDVRWLLGDLGVVDVGVPSGVKTFDSRLTDSDNVSMRKPELGEWDSARASPDDAVVLAKRLGLPYSEDDSDD